MIHDPTGFDPTARVLADLEHLRLTQIADFGHNRHADLAAPLLRLPEKARAEVLRLIEDVQFNKRDLMRRHALKAASLLVAFIERLDAEAEEPIL